MFKLTIVKDHSINPWGAFPNVEDPLPVYDTTYEEELIKRISK